MIKKLARWLCERPRFILFVAVLLMIPSVLGYIATKTNYDVLQYLPEDYRSVQGERLLEDPFKAAATSMVVVEGMPPEYSDKLLNEIKDVPHVSNTFWISNSLGVQVPVNLLPEDLQKDFFNGDATMMIVQFDTALSADETMDAVVEIRKIMNKNCFLAGMSGMVEDIKELVLEELPWYTLIAVGLTLLVLLFSFESYAMPFIFLACIGFAVIYNLGTNIFRGQICYITKSIAAILQLGVTMDYSIFLYRRYEEEKERHSDIRDAMAEAMSAAFASLSGSSLTTIAGFLALCAMRMTIGADMGIVMAKGVVLGIVCVILILPCMILIFDKQIEKYQHKNLFPDFTNLNKWILRHRRLWILFFLLMIFPALYSSNHTYIYYQISRSLPDDLPSKIADDKLKEYFDMATEHVVVMKNSIDNGSLGEMEDRLEDVKGVEHVISYHSIIGDGIPDFFLPDKIRKVFKSGDYQLVMITSDFKPATNEIREQLSEIEDIVYQYDPDAYLTGEPPMTEDMRTIFSEDTITTNYISIAAIFAIVAIVFKSLTVPAALIIVIELAININQGICYWQGQSISFIAPILISSIQLGSTVDYAILVSTRFQEEIRNGKDRREAAMIAGKTADPSIITSSLCMFSATIGVTLVSRMFLIKEICMLLARGAIISALLVAFVLPCLLYYLEPFFRRTTIDWDGSKARAKQEALEAEEAALEIQKIGDAKEIKKSETPVS